MLVKHLNFMSEVQLIMPYTFGTTTNNLFPNIYKKMNFDWMHIMYDVMSVYLLYLQQTEIAVIASAQIYDTFVIAGVIFQCDFWFELIFYLFQSNEIGHRMALYNDRVELNIISTSISRHVHMHTYPLKKLLL